MNKKNFFLFVSLLILILAFGFLIAKSPLLGIVSLSLLIFLFWLFLNFKLGPISIILTLVLGQLTRIPLPFGGSIVLNDLLIPLVFMAWFLIKLAKGRLLVYKTYLNLPLAIFISIALFSLLLNPAQLAFPELIQSSAYLSRFVTYALVLWMVLDTVRDKQTWQKFYSLAIWIGVLFAFLGFLQLIFIPSFEFMTRYGWDPHFNRLLSTFFDPNYAGGFLVLVIALVLGRMLFTKNKAEKGILFYAFLFLLAAIVSTFSRSTYLAFLITFLVIGILKSWRLLLLGIIGLVIIFFAVPRVQERILGAVSLDITAQMRLESFSQAYEIIKDYPIIGTGYNTLRFVRQDYGQVEGPKQMTAGGFDSSFLTILATTGIIGFMVYLWLCFSILKESLKSFLRKRSPPVLRGLALGILAGFLGLIIHSQFVNSLFYPHIMVYLWFILGLLFSYPKSDKL